MKLIRKLRIGILLPAFICFSCAYPIYAEGDRSEELATGLGKNCESVLSNTSFRYNTMDYFLRAYTVLAYIEGIAIQQYEASTDSELENWQSKLQTLRKQGTCLISSSAEDSTTLQKAFLSGEYSSYISGLIMLASDLYTLRQLKKSLAACELDDEECIEYDKKGIEKQLEELLVRANSTTRSLSDTWVQISGLLK